MSSLLAWQSGKHSHRQQLHQFVCTDVHPARRARNWRDGLDRWWEYEVQSMIRALEPPYRNGRHLRIGSDEQGLAAVSLLEELDGP